MYEGLVSPSPTGRSVRLWPKDTMAARLITSHEPAATPAAARGSHGALRDDDEEDHLAISIPSFNGNGHATSVVSTMMDDGPLGSSALAATKGPQPTRSFYGHAKAQLLGIEPRVPRFYLNSTFRYNSFFARRLLRVAAPLVAVMTTGLGFYYFYAPHSLVLNPDEQPVTYGFKLQSPSSVYTFQASACENMVGFSALTFHAMPLMIILALPGTGLRAFEPFQREHDVDDAGHKNKIKRTLVFQACEMVGVIVVVFAMITMLFFWFMFFNGGAFSCSEHPVQIFALVALVCFVGIFVELVYFARFREHVKMQLGAFKEEDQTGDVRNHVMDPGLDQLMNKNDKVIATVRKRLYKATRLGDLREMRDVLEYAKAKDLDAKGFPMAFYSDARIYLRVFGVSKKNPMHVAAYNGNIAALQLLHTYGFEVTTLDKFDRVRFSTGDLFWYFARYFVSKPVGAEDENAVSIFKTTLVTPLHCAVATGQLETVRWLIAHGADVGTMARSSYRSERVPPLFLAEHQEIVRELLEHGANHLVIPDPGYMNTLTVLQLAYLRENYAVAQELEEWGCDVALTPFHSAAAMNDVARVRKYIRRRVDLNCLGEHGYCGMNRRTPLHWAAVNGAVQSVELLLEAGADPNFQDIRGRSALHWAARLNRLEVITLLLEKGAKPDLVDVDQMTPLVCAAYGKDTSREVFSALVNAGGNINYQLPSSGDTALHVAVREEHEESALAILACGGNLMRVNNEGLRPLDCTTSTKLLFEIKQAAGHRDVMISYTHSHSEFAKKLRKSLEDSNVTTWLDLMDPSGIGGGSVWREEIARGITNAALVVCILTEDYAQSEWCLKELALAKQVGTPILAVSTESVRIGEDLQVYLYTRQLIPFEPAITVTKRNAENVRQIEYEYDDRKYKSQFRLLLDGVRDEIEKRREAAVQSGKNRKRAPMGTALSANGTGFSKMFQSWEMATGGTGGEAQPFVFLSHGDKHVTFVRQLVQELRNYGIMCYGDHNAADQDFENRIHAAQEAILKCTCFIAILSNQTMTSELVRDQLAFAEDKGRPIFPIMLNEVEVGLDKHYSLARNELFHFVKSGMGFKASTDLLVTGLRRFYRRPSESSNGTMLTDAQTSFVSFAFDADGGVNSSSGSRLMEGQNQPTVIDEDDVAVYDDDSRTPTGLDQNEVRNFESISSALENVGETAGLNLSMTRVRM